MLHKLSLMAAPTGLSPGGYVPKAYADRNTPGTPVAELEASHRGGLWRIRLRWDCSEPVLQLGDDVDLFVDAAAVIAPSEDDAPLMTMGAPGKAVEGALWHADRQELLAVRAEGLGTVQRSDAPAAWTVHAEWTAGQWHLEFALEAWPILDARQRLAIAIWQGSQRERAGLKSISPGWIEVGS